MRDGAIRLWVLGMLAWAAPALATAAPVAGPPAPETVTALVRDHLNRAGTPGAQVMVVQGGRSLYARAFGSCGLRPMTLSDPLPLGGISQPMLGAAALRLDAAGRADLDKPAPTPDLAPLHGNLLTCLTPRFGEQALLDDHPHASLALAIEAARDCRNRGQIPPP